MLSGGPPEASKEQLNKSKKGASKAANAVKSRHTSNFISQMVASSMPDPDEEEESDVDCGKLELWKLLPQLKELPESLLRKLSISAMFQLNTALGKENKTAEKLGVNSKLARNSKKLVKNPIRVEKGVDNRKDVLHPARFLGVAPLPFRSSGAQPARSSVRRESSRWVITTSRPLDAGGASHPRGGLSSIIRLPRSLGSSSFTCLTSAVAVPHLSREMARMAEKIPRRLRIL